MAHRLNIGHLRKAVEANWFAALGGHVSTDKKGMKILARTFFNQLRSSGYTQRQIIELSTELLDLVSTGVREGEKDVPASNDAQIQDWRQAV